MKGLHPIRRTYEHIKNTNLFLKPFIRIFAFHYNPKFESHQGTVDFVHWHSAQLQYHNPDVQVISFRNLTPTPFLRVFFDNGQDMLMDVDRQTKDEVHQRIVDTLCKTEEELKEERKASAIKQNPAHFGYGCPRHCMCEIPGQIPCPALVPLPYHMRGKYRMGFAELDESKYV